MKKFYIDGKEWTCDFLDVFPTIAIATVLGEYKDRRYSISFSDSYRDDCLVYHFNNCDIELEII